MTTTDAAAAATTPERAALDRARALARAIGATDACRRLEAAQEALDADGELRLRIGKFNVREQELRSARSWGGADPDDERALEREWQDLALQPPLAAHLAARQELVTLFGEVAAAISDGVGLDYRTACVPSSGCCG